LWSVAPETAAQAFAPCRKVCINKLSIVLKSKPLKKYVLDQTLTPIVLHRKNTSGHHAETILAIFYRECLHRNVHRKLPQDV